jgi:hypothetical protein
MENSQQSEKTLKVFYTFKISTFVVPKKIEYENRIDQREPYF